MTDQEFWAQFEERANNALKKWEVPSFGLGVIKDGKVVMSRGFGKRDIENDLDADGQTLYQIGSCTKAFTAAICAKLVDEGKLKWDEKVRTYLPDFKFYDDFMSKEATIQDILCHRTGMPRHEYSWYNTKFTREELVDNMRYLEPNIEPRVELQYSNHCFILAGVICEKITGKTWEELLQEYIFDPLQMTHTNAYIDAIKADKDHAEPYGRTAAGKMEGMKKIPFYKTAVEDMSKGIGASLAPAGSINSCAEDMLKWVSMHLHDGKYNDVQVLSKESVDELHKPQMLRNNPFDMPNDLTQFMSYGLGWFTEMYRGHKYVQHGGNINGFSAYTGFVPDLDLGIVCYTNMNSNFLHFAMARDIMDHYMGYDDIEWSDRYYDYCQMRIANGLGMKYFTGEKIEGTKPSRDISEFCGTYERKGYEPVSVYEEDGQLKMSFNGMKSNLDHFHYDTYVTSAEVGELPVGFPATFEKGDRSGQIEKMAFPVVTEAGADVVRFYKVKE